MVEGTWFDEYLQGTDPKWWKHVRKEYCNAEESPSSAQMPHNFRDAFGDEAEFFKYVQNLGST